ncbi:MAG: Smr/MutS family protein [Candidatus Lokiarchaeota archaeon]
MEIDIHGLRLWEAIDEILYFLEECKANDIKEISIIHGYHHGNILKDYIRSEGFIIEIAKNGFISFFSSRP